MGRSEAKSHPFQAANAPCPMAASRPASVAEMCQRDPPKRKAARNERMLHDCISVSARFQSEHFRAARAIAHVIDLPACRQIATRTTLQLAAYGDLTDRKPPREANAHWLGI